MLIIRKGKEQFFINRKLVIPDDFPAVGINALAVNLVSAPVAFVPLHFTTPAVFIHIPSAQRKNPVLFPLKIPFLKYGNPVLQGYIGKVIVVIIYRMTVFKVVDAS
ncbi:hypothetical protein D3C86_1969540 [compost metagenome]